MPRIVPYERPLDIIAIARRFADVALPPPRLQFPGKPVINRKVPDMKKPLRPRLPVVGAAAPAPDAATPQSGAAAATATQLLPITAVKTKAAGPVKTPSSSRPPPPPPSASPYSAPAPRAQPRRISNAPWAAAASPAAKNAPTRLRAGDRSAGVGAPRARGRTRGVSDVRDIETAPVAGQEDPAAAVTGDGSSDCGDTLDGTTQ